MDAPRIGQVRVLLVQTAFLGDIILFTSVISAVKERHPDAEIWLLTTAAGEEALRFDSRLSRIIVFKKRGEDAGLGGLFRLARQLRESNFSVVYSAHKSFRTALLLWLAKIPERIGFDAALGGFLYSKTLAAQGSHAVERLLSLIGDPQELSPKHGLALTACPDAEIRAEQRDWARSSKRVLVAPGSAWETKRWSKEHYKDVVLKLIAEGWDVAVIGAPDERPVCEFVAAGTGARFFAGGTSIAQAIWLVKNAQLILCNDSALLHAASAFKVPTAAVFCATTPEQGFGPWQNISEIFGAEELECRPCGRHGGRRCPTGTGACMKNPGPVEVFAGIQRLMTRSAGESQAEVN